MTPRIAMAIVKAVLYFVLFYALPVFVVSQVSQFMPEIFTRYSEILQVFVAVLILFTVAAELTKGTIYQHAFNVGKAIVLLVFFVLAFSGGIIDVTVQGVHIRADLTVYLLMLITIDLLGLAKSVLQAIDFMHEKAEQQLPTPRPVE
jgi:hypothetical protein